MLFVNLPALVKPNTNFFKFKTSFNSLRLFFCFFAVLVKRFLGGGVT